VASLQAELADSQQEAATAATDTAKQLAAKQSEADKLAAVLAAAKHQIAEQVCLLIGLFCPWNDIHLGSITGRLHCVLSVYMA